MKNHSPARRRWFNWIQSLFPMHAKVSRSAPRRPLRSCRPQVEALEDRVAPTTVNWGGGSGNWNDGANWIGGNVPGAGDDAVINVASAVTITIQSGDNISVQSVTTASTDTLSITSGGALTVTAGNSALSGPLSMTGSTLTANGANVNLTASNNSTSASQTTLIAQSGATLSLPNLLSYSSGGTEFQATGAGSVIDVSALTTITHLGGNWTVNAQSGGEVDLSGLTHLTSTQGISFNDTGSSTLLDPNLATLFGVSVNTDGSDSPVLNAWTTVTDGTISVSGGALTLPNLTDLDNPIIVLGNGANAEPVRGPSAQPLYWRNRQRRGHARRHPELQ